MIKEGIYNNGRRVKIGFGNIWLISSLKNEFLFSLRKIIFSVFMSNVIDPKFHGKIIVLKIYVGK